MMSRIVTTSERRDRSIVPEKTTNRTSIPGDRRERDRVADRHAALAQPCPWPAWPPAIAAVVTPGRARRGRGRCRRGRGRGRRCRRRSPPRDLPATDGRQHRQEPVGRPSRPSAAARVGPVALAPDVRDLGLAVDRRERHQVDHRVDARGVRELEVAAVAEGVVRAGVDADPAQDAAALVDLVLLEDARLRHEGAGRAGLGAAAAGHARRVVEAHVERRRHERVEADPHEVVAGRADDLRADLGAAAAVDAARRLAQDERVGVVADVVVVDAGEAVLRHGAVAGALVVLRLERLERRPVLDPEAAQVAEADRLARALEAARRLGDGLLAACTGSRTRCSCRLRTSGSIALRR